MLKKNYFITIGEPRHGSDSQVGDNVYPGYKVKYSLHLKIKSIIV